MIKKDPVLSKAALLAKKKDYDGALTILKTAEEDYSGSFKFYYLYAVICLHCGSYLEAHEFFNLARKIKIKDTGTWLGFAVLNLRRMNTSQAVNYYLEVLEMDSSNRTAKKALDVIRKHSSQESLTEWLTPGRLEKFFPEIPSPGITAKTVLNFSLVCVLGLVAVFWILVALRVLPSPVKKPDIRGVSEFILTGQERSQPVETGGSYRYILTRDQSISLYERALALFTSYRDEAARINVNRLLESNASEDIKNKGRLLFLYMEVPGFDNFNRNDNPSISDVIAEPFLYRDVHVIWRGMATNIEITDEFTGFEFLVGYDTRRTLEGIIPVKFKSPLSINPDRPLEVLGRIKLVSSYSEVELEGIAVYQSGRLE
ncbi:MAG: tetratricopeptide repeat protein [Treponema sp.]|nr:tetratricopeptide repeat protein [Treponema sp.]